MYNRVIFINYLQLDNKIPKMDFKTNSTKIYLNMPTLSLNPLKLAKIQ